MRHLSEHLKRFFAKMSCGTRTRLLKWDTIQLVSDYRLLPFLMWNKFFFAFLIKIKCQFRTLTKKTRILVHFSWASRVTCVSQSFIIWEQSILLPLHFQEKHQISQLSQFIKCPRKSFFSLFKFLNYKERNFRQKLEKAEREKQEYKDLADRQEARVSTVPSFF